jgi:signal peptidase I
MKDKNTHSRLLNELSGLAETMLISLFVVSLAFTYIFRTTTIIGSSMNETLSEGDRVIMTAG